MAPEGRKVGSLKRQVQSLRAAFCALPLNSSLHRATSRRRCRPLRPCWDPQPQASPLLLCASDSRLGVPHLSSSLASSSCKQYLLLAVLLLGWLRYWNPVFLVVSVAFFIGSEMGLGPGRAVTEGALSAASSGGAVLATPLLR